VACCDDVLLESLGEDEQDDSKIAELKEYLEAAKTKADEAEEAYKKAKEEHATAVEAKKAIDDEIVKLNEYAAKVVIAADKAEEEYKKALDWTDGEVQQKAFERT
jgi:chromosome segregation ATPase